MRTTITSRRQAMVSGALAFLLAGWVGIAANGLLIHLYDWLSRVLSSCPWALMVWRRREAFHEILALIAIAWLFGALPLLGGGAVYGRMLHRLQEREGGVRRGWAGCLAMGVMLAAMEIAALIVACHVLRFTCGRAEWVELVGKWLLVFSPCSLLLAHVAGRWLWRGMALHDTALRC